MCVCPLRELEESLWNNPFAPLLVRLLPRLMLLICHDLADVHTMLCEIRCFGGVKNLLMVSGDLRGSRKV